MLLQIARGLAVCVTYVSPEQLVRVALPVHPRTGICTARLVPAELPARIRALLEQRVDSFAKLHVVVTLFDAPGHTMSFEALCRALRELPERALELVDEARHGGLIEGPLHELRLVTTDLEVLAELVAVNGADPTSVAQYLSSASIRRIRSLVVRNLLDADRTKK